MTTNPSDKFIVTRRAIRALIMQAIEPANRHYLSTPEQLADSWLEATPDVQPFPDTPTQNG
jgi:hypothetical protein